MVRLVVLLGLVAAIVLAPSGARATGIRERRPNIVSGELVGRAPLLSVGYERYLTSRIGVGTGIGYFPVILQGDRAWWTFPLYLSIIPAGDTHSPYLSAGVTYVHEVESDNSLLLAFFSGGYQYQSERGIFLRATVNWLVGGADFSGNWGVGVTSVAIPGLAVGFSF